MKTTKHNLIQLCLLGAVLLQAATSNAQPVTKIAAGGSQSFFLKSGGSLWVMGANDYGQLGDGTASRSTSPKKIVTTNVTAIAGGGIHSLFLKSDSSLWGMGYNGDGELGDTTYNDAHSPEKIVNTNVTAIAAGEWHSLFLKTDGSLWAMGWNSFGQLGDGNILRPDVNNPVRIVTTNVTAIAAGWNHSLFIKSDGSLWGMGDNSSGQLGDGTWDAQLYPEKIVDSGVTAIAAGQFHSVFLKSDGSFWGMGYNYNGELGDRTFSNTNRTEQILAPYNRIAIDLLAANKVRLSFVGLDRTNYALDRTYTLLPTVWVPQTTNAADSVGLLVLTNAPNPATNNFWQIRTVP